MKVSDYIIKVLKDEGIKDVFMLPGGGCIHLVDSLKKNNLNYIVNLHEQAASIAAEAYAQYTNNLGVCLTTTGPGATNAITGCAGAWLDSIPVIYISGQVQLKDIKTKDLRQKGFQEINIIDIVSPITKYAETIKTVDEVKYKLAKAIFYAKSGRPGPVWLDIPLDIQAADINKQNLIFNKQNYFSNDTINNDIKNNNKAFKNDLKLLVEDLNNAKRPVLLVGNGIRLAGAEKEFEELINILNIPVLTTWKAIDFLDEEHPLYVGRPGTIGQRGANFTQQNSDMLISIGARLDSGQTAYQHKFFAPHAIKAVVDVDLAELNKLDMMHVQYKILADAKKFIIAFIEMVKREYHHHNTILINNNNITNKESWLQRSKRLHKEFPVCLPEYYKEKGYVNAYVLIDVLSKLLTKNAIIIPGSSGTCSEVTMQAFKVKKGQKIFNTEGLGAMGYDIPAALGGCIASGNKHTICITGDGSFVMNMQDLETIKRLNLPIKFFVLNNNGYLSIRNTQDKHFNGIHVASDKKSGLTLPSLEKIANAFGIKSYILSSHTNIERNIQEILNYNGPAIINVHSSFTHQTIPRVSVYKDNNEFKARPMEDLEPLLDRMKFKECMLWKKY